MWLLGVAFQTSPSFLLYCLSILISPSVFFTPLTQIEYLTVTLSQFLSTPPFEPGLNPAWTSQNASGFFDPP